MSDLDKLKSASISKRFHQTWANTFRCKPDRYVQPSTIDEIQAVVRQAQKQKRTVMLTGSGHSPSDMTMTSDWVMNLDKFKQAVSFKPHHSGKFTDVTVEAGIRIFQLNEILAKRGLAIQNLGSISDQSIAGIISTGTHGASAYHGLVSQQIVNLTIMIASGELITCSPTENPILFRAAMLSLGKLGIIVYATIRTVPSYTIHSCQEVITFDQLFKLWPTLWTSSEFVRVWWFPYTRKCILWRANKSNKPLSPPRPSWYGTWVGRKFYEALLWFAVNLYPAATPGIEKWVFNQQYGKTVTYENGGSEAVQGSVDGLNMDCLFSQFVNEWGMPLSSGLDVLEQLESAINKAALNDEFYVHAPIEVRCSNTTSSGSLTDDVEDIIDPNTSDISQKGAIPGNNLKPLLDITPELSYTANQDEITNDNLTLYINATMYRPFGFNSPVGKWYRIFEDIVYAVGGKPHWAKNFIGTLDVEPTYDGQMQGLKPTMDEWYGENLQTWKSLRRKYDPDGVFLSGKEWAVRNGLVDEDE
ncbi:D-arabinono-1,4-lactone oxidase [Nadsonia fulvescens var. elongata DSM 6958]|uniref:D-arabinono-1,4-lactone oxidase n=1 Tax=Nadsonia fulvescens var. elongata DSM 6958 TaxID=857566 RepID=A0A1E3PSH0_9ASCO|nr:D-arabinono-1,4-lactone oxidase [Nadsonia fulvescens var. elongata DSM 6958]